MTRGNIRQERSNPLSRWAGEGWGEGLLACACLFGCGEAPDLPQPIERAASTAPSTLAVTVENGLVTVHARDASLEAIVQEIARQSRLAVASHEPLVERVTLDLERLPLSDALGRVLRNGSFVLSVAHELSPSAASPAVPRKLWLLSSAAGAAQRAPTKQATDRDSIDAAEITASVGLALSYSDANARADAVSALGSARDNPEAASLAHAALSDADPAVREEAAHALGEIGGDMSLHALEQALRDPQRDVKRTAIEALVSIGGEQAAQVLAPVIDDPDPTLRDAAVDALREVRGDGK